MKAQVCSPARACSARKSRIQRGTALYSVPFDWLIKCNRTGSRRRRDACAPFASRSARPAACGSLGSASLTLRCGHELPASGVPVEVATLAACWPVQAGARVEVQAAARIVVHTVCRVKHEAAGDSAGVRLRVDASFRGGGSRCVGVRCGAAGRRRRGSGCLCLLYTSPSPRDS